MTSGGNLVKIQHLGDPAPGQLHLNRGLFEGGNESNFMPRSCPIADQTLFYLIQQLRTHFATLDDQRVELTKRHQLLDILTIAFWALLCGADNWVEIEIFGNANRAF